MADDFGSENLWKYLQHMDRERKKMTPMAQLTPKLVQRVNFLIQVINKMRSDNDNLSFRIHRTYDGEDRIEHVEIRLLLFPGSDD